MTAPAMVAALQVHTMAHSWLGGIWNTGAALPRPVCFLTYAVTVPANWQNGCIVCPKDCAATASADPHALCQCEIADEWRCVADKTFLPIPTYGDFADVWTSPVRPVALPRSPAPPLPLPPHCFRCLHLISCC